MAQLIKYSRGAARCCIIGNRIRMNPHLTQKPTASNVFLAQFKTDKRQLQPFSTSVHRCGSPPPTSSNKQPSAIENSVAVINSLSR